MTAFTDRPALAKVAAGAYLTVVVAAAVVAVATRPHLPALPDRTLLTVAGPVWMLWALLPAISGGGDVETADRLAPYPTSARFHVYATWMSALLDVQYLLVGPAVAVVAAAIAGPVGLVAAATFTLGSSATGQLLGWAATGGLLPAWARRHGPLPAVAVTTATAAAGLGAATIWAPHGLTGVLPPGLLVLASTGGWAAAAAHSALVAPVVVLLAAGPAMARRALAVRAVSTRAVTHTPLRWPTRPGRALYAAHLAGIGRSVAARAAATSAAAVPFLLALTAPAVDPTTVATMIAVSSGATLAVNSYAFDAGGARWVAASPVPARTRVLAKAAAAGTAVAALTGGTLALDLVVRHPDGLGRALLSAPLLVALVTASGTATAVSAPVAADMDSLRARPTSLRAGVTFTVRTAVLVLVVNAATRVGDLGWVAAVVLTGGYTGWALWGAKRRLANGATITAAFS